MPITKVNITDAFVSINERWDPKIGGEVSLDEWSGGSSEVSGICLVMHPTSG